MKNSVLSFFLLLLFSPVWSQEPSPVVNKIATDICEQLEDLNSIEEVDVMGKKVLLAAGLTMHYGEWNEEIDKFEHGEQVLLYAVVDQLLRTCPKYRILDNKTDETVSDKPLTPFYLQQKNFYYDLSGDVPFDSLLLHLDPKIRDKNGIARLDSLQKELKQHIETGYTFQTFVPSQVSTLFTLTNYTNNKDAVILKLWFNDQEDLLIDKIEFFGAEKLEAARIEREANPQEFKLPPVPPPPPPPPPPPAPKSSDN